MFKKLFLAKDILLLKYGHCNPLAVTIWVTEKCNSHCVFCDFWKKHSPVDLNFETFNTQLEKSKILKKIKFFGFTGGEPFLNNDIDLFVESIVKKANPIQIRFASNGLATNLIVRNLSAICESNPNTSINIKLSVDGTEKTHDRLRNTPGNFVKTMKTIEKLNKLEFPNLSIGLGFTASALNYKEINSVLNIAKEKKLGFFYKPVVNSKVIKSNVEKNLFLDEDKINFIKKEAHANIVDYYSNLNFIDKIVHKKYLAYLETYYKEKKRETPCYACSASFHISAKGDVFPCIQRPIVVGNIYKKPFDDIWKSNKSYKIRKVIKTSDCHCTCSSEMFPNIVISSFPFLW